MPLRFYQVAAALCAFALTPPPAQAQIGEQRADDGAIDEMAARFAALPTASRLQLSPDGRRLLFIDRSKPLPIVHVADIDSGAVEAIARSSEAMSFETCRWLSDERIGCSAFGTFRDVGRAYNYSRYIAMDTDGDNALPLGQRMGSRTLGLNQFSGRVIDVLPDDPEHILMAVNVLPERQIGTRLAKSDEGMTVQRVNIHNGQMRTITGPIGDAVTYYTDGRGNARVYLKNYETAGGFMGDRFEYRIRADGRTNRWEELTSQRASSAAYASFEGFSEDGQSVYMILPHEGRHALFRQSADRSGEPELVFAHDWVDVNGLVTFGRYRRPVGVSWSDDYNHIEFFDEELKALNESLDRALDGEQSITLLSESWDGDRILLLATSDRNPGTYYIFEKSTKQLIQLIESRAYLDGIDMGTVTPIRYSAADNTEISGYLTLPAGQDAETAENLPLIVMPHGGPNARDYWGFDWLAQAFAAKGYAVVQPNYRGSQGFGTYWAGENALRNWRQAISDVNDAARWAIGTGLTSANKVAAVGWSYGGYAALQGAVVDPQLYNAVVAIAPVTDLELLVRNASSTTARNVVREMVGEGPHLVDGSPARWPHVFEVPVQMFHGSEDVNVNVRHSRHMAKRLEDAGKPVDYVEYDGLEHDLARTSARADMLTRIFAFLDAELGD